MSSSSRSHAPKAKAKRNHKKFRDATSQRGCELVWVGTTNVPRLPAVTEQVVTMVQQLPDQLISQVANSVGAGSYVFTFGQLDQYAQLGYVFDQYRFDCIEVTFRPTGNAIPLQVAAVVVPQLYTAIDYDDNGTLTLPLIRAYANCALSTAETQVRRFVPAMAVAAYAGTFTAYAARQRQWCDCASIAIQHYGIKYCIDAGNTGQTLLQTWNVSFRVRVSFKYIR